LNQEEFKSIVRKVWSEQVAGETALDRWQNRIRMLRKKAKWWNKNRESRIKKRKHQLKEDQEKLEVIAESRDLSKQEWDSLRCVSDKLEKILDIEEVKARQRSIHRNVKEVDRNTKYFHAVANQRKRKNTIYDIEGPERVMNSTKDIIKVATQYYNELFKFEPRPKINISNSFFFEGEKVSEGENAVLEDRFTEEEIKKVVFESFPDGALGPDGVSFTFYQHFWDVIKGDLLEMFDDFHNGRLDLYRPNFALVTIIHKEKDARTMNMSRPISLLNYSYKIFKCLLIELEG
jgi:hypothetical protein